MPLLQPSRELDSQHTFMPTWAAFPHFHSRLGHAYLAPAHGLRLRGDQLLLNHGGVASRDHLALGGGGHGGAGHGGGHGLPGGQLRDPTEGLINLRFRQALALQKLPLLIRRRGTDLHGEYMAHGLGPGPSPRARLWSEAGFRRP